MMMMMNGAAISRFASRKMFTRGGRSTSWWLAAALSIVGFFVWRGVLEAVQQQPPTPKQQKGTTLIQQLSAITNKQEEELVLLSPKQQPGEKNDSVHQEQQQQSSSESAQVDTFPPPLYGYDSIEEMNGRVERFPDVQERVQVYMSNWYLPPCQQTDSAGSNDKEQANADDGLIHYRFVPSDPKNWNGDLSSFSGKLLVREVDSDTEFVNTVRTFELDGNTTLGKLHFMVKKMMRPENCDSEYCVDTLRYWYPAQERVGVVRKTIGGGFVAVPVLFQFSDEELSRAYRPETDQNEPYPGLPHLKKSRLSLLPQDITPYRKCTPVPRPILPTIADTQGLQQHLQPSKLHNVLLVDSIRASRVQCSILLILQICLLCLLSLVFFWCYLFV